MATAVSLCQERTVVLAGCLESSKNGTFGEITSAISRLEYIIIIRMKINDDQ